MAIAKEFEEAGYPNARKKDLHQIIVGPLRSGKTTKAHDYAKLLFEKGLVESADPVCENGGYMGASLSISDINQHLNLLLSQSQNRVLIIDEADKMKIDLFIHVMKLALIQKDGPILVLVGDAEKMQKMIGKVIDEIKTDPALAPLEARMPTAFMRPPVTTERSFSHEEMQRYNEPTSLANKQPVKQPPASPRQ
jgi:hypothetical protein